MKKSTFSKRIKQLRKNNDLTMEQLADRLGIKKSTVSMWENNGNLPMAKMLILISNEFDVSIDYLLGTSNVNHARGKKKPWLKWNK